MIDLYQYRSTICGTAPAPNPPLDPQLLIERWQVLSKEIQQYQAARNEASRC
jgi:hypothetical protein